MNSIYPIFNSAVSCDFHRVYNPLRLMGVDFAEAASMPYTEALKSYPLVVLNRLPKESVATFLHRKSQYGFKLVVDLDDYFTLPETHYLYKNWVSNGVSTRLITMLRAADVVTVTNHELADKVLPYNKNVEIVPNGLPYKEIDAERFVKQDIPGVTRFIYAAGSSHAPDVQLLYTGLWLLDRKVKWDKQTYEIRLAGIDQMASHAEQWEYMRKVMSLDGDMTGPGYFKAVPAMPVTDYLKLYKTADVALAPLVDNTFNRCKSNLKVLEAAAYNLPIIASQVHPYYNPTDLDYVHLAEKPEHFAPYMELMAKDPDYRNTMGKALGQHCRKHYELTNINKIRQQIYSHLISK
jgi:glycosyltransferase involved in cell wall biosynthesis